MRAPRPAAVALALCLGAAAGLPAVWLLTRPADDVGARPSAVAAAPPSSQSGTPTAAVAPVSARPASPAVVDPAGTVPTRVLVPAVGIDATVVPVGVARDGAMRLPRDATRAGWYRFGPRPGAGTGSVVLAAHVDTRTQGRGAFYPLRQSAPGDRVTVVTTDGGKMSYRVVSRELLSKRTLPLDELFRRGGREVLTLITCGGPYLRDAGGYQDNVVVTAVGEQA